MDRRRFLRESAAALAAAQLAGCGTSGRARRPNLLLIMADDLGYADLGVTGRTDYRTPAIDAFAREGTRLTQAYASAPVCTPTRVALMTGRYPARTRAGLFEPLTTSPDGLPPDPPTLPRLLKDRGYETGLIGKWHLGLAPEFHPLRHGFDEFYGFLGAAADYASHVDTEAGRSTFYDGHQLVRTDGYLTDLFSSRAVAFIGRRRETPFFLSLQYNAPHWPWQGPGDPPYPDSVGATAGGSPTTYARMVQRLDDGVAQVLRAVAERGIERDTLVIFTSDNGGERYSRMGPFRGSKMTLYEGGIRVAAFARWPGVLAAGATCDQVCATMDWTATLLAAAGAPASPAAPLDGIDLLPILRGGIPPRPRELFWRITQRARHRAARVADLKYLVTDQGESLFDLAVDPGETADLASRRPADLARLRDAYASWEREMLPAIPLDPRYA